MRQPEVAARRHDGFMTDACILDHITFEVPYDEAAEDLCRLLGTAHRYTGENEAWSVHIELGSDPAEVSSILRRVEAWVAARRLLAIRFQLDDRWYVMESGEAIWALEAA
jgi:hypothetical protein